MDYPTVATVVDTAPLTAETIRLALICQASQKASIAAREHLAGCLTPEQDRLVSAYIDNFEGTHRSDFLNLVQADIARHMPGLSPALFLIFEHVMTVPLGDFGRCCVDEAAS